MADDAKRRGLSLVLAILLAFAVSGVAVFGYLYLGEEREVVKVDVPGFEGALTKGGGVDIKVGQD